MDTPNVFDNVNTAPKNALTESPWNDLYFIDLNPIFYKRALVNKLIVPKCLRRQRRHPSAHFGAVETGQKIGVWVGKRASLAVSGGHHALFVRIGLAKNYLRHGLVEYRHSFLKLPVFVEFFQLIFIQKLERQVSYHKRRL